MDAARRAARENARLRAALPLFADQLEPVTAADVEAKRRRDREAAQRYVDRLRAAEQLQARGLAAREVVRRLVSDEVFEALMRRWRGTPGTGEYTADLWCGALRALGLFPTPW